MASYGKIDEFSSETDDWTEYTERLTQYFLANDIEEENKKKAILLSVCGAKSYSLLRSLTTPARPHEKTFKQLLEIMQQHQSPRPSCIVQRFKFNTCKREQRETVAEYVAKLRKLSEHCEYNDILEDMLRDRLVCGINDERIQRRLLAEHDLGFKKAFEIAQGMETAAKNSRDLRGASSDAEVGVNKIIGAKSSKTRQPWRRDKQDRARDTKPVKPCYRCLGNHQAHACPYIKATCFSCSKVGHVRKACRSQAQASRGDTGHSKVKLVTDESTPDDTRDGRVYELFSVGTKTKTSPYMAQLVVNDKPIAMEVDTGASVSLINKDTYMHTWAQDSAPKLQKTDTTLRSYTGNDIPLMGVTDVTVTHEGQQAELQLYIVDNNTPNLMGRDWMDAIKLNWKRISRVTVSENDIISQYPELFTEGLGSVTGHKGHIYVDKDAQPRFYKPRQIPYAMKDKVDKEIDRLLAEGIISPIKMNDWAAPIVPVLKANGEVRLCGDFKVTINQASKLDKYPLPKISDLYATLSGGETYSRLDLSNAYLQINLDEESRKYVAINTHRGLFVFNRLPYGVASSPAIFQRIVDDMLRGIPNVCVYLDDILITGKSDTDHARNLHAVLQRLSAAGFRLRKEKCVYSVSSVTYLGFRIDREGIHPVKDSMKAIVDAPSPKNVTELRSYLGMLNYYGKFLPNLSTVLTPLHALLHKNVRYNWTERQEQAFTKSKQLVQSSQLLVHYDPNKPIALACDASPYGVGAVISHVMEDGDERPICFASRSLTKAEQGYSQLEKETLACVWGVKKFHNYLYGRPFTIYNDHRPLEGLLRDDKVTPVMAAARIQRWALTLGAYHFKFVYKPGKLMSHCDALSRLPGKATPTEVPEVQETVFLVDMLSTTPVSFDDIEAWTDKDTTLSRVKHYILHGWCDVTEAHLHPYASRRTELSVHAGCVLWGLRVVIPPPGRETVLHMLHDTHPGIVKMKNLARSYVWWPKMDSELETMVKTCTTCQSNRNAPAVAPLHPWEHPPRAWARIHIDYAGPVDGKMLLVIVDAYTKWIEVHVMSTSTASATVDRLRTTFATFGIPETVVSDNGTCFTSHVFKDFMDRNGIRHVTVAPFHPSSNGLAERAVQTVKSGVQRLKDGSLQTRVSRMLFHYRVTPQSTTGKTPCELMFGRKLRTHLDMLHPDERSKVEEQQEKQKAWHDQKAVSREFDVGDTVYARNYATGSRWLTGVIHTRTGPVSYTVKLTDDSRIWRRHVDQIRVRHTQECPGNDGRSVEELSQPGNVPDTRGRTPDVHEDVPQSVTADESPVSVTPPSSPSTSPSVVSPSKSQEPPVLRRSSRPHKQTVFFKAV